jgi:hypothetical protein
MLCRAPREDTLNGAIPVIRIKRRKLTRAVKIGLATIALAGLTAPTYAANGGLYFGVDAMNWTFDQYGATPSTDNGKASGTGFRGVIGSNFSPNFGWEGHLGMGGSGASGGALGTISMDAIAGFFVRGNVPLGRGGDIHGLLGFSSARFSNAVSTTLQGGLSYGFGAQFAFSQSAAVRADYVLYTSDSIWKASAVTVGVNFGF